jgi:hypothetical protein
MTRMSGIPLWRRGATILAIGLVCGTAARADLFPCLCHHNQRCCPPEAHPSYGYNPTQWRAWSGPETAPTPAPVLRSNEVPLMIPTSYVPPAGPPVERNARPSVQQTAEPPALQPTTVAPPQRTTLLNLDRGNPADLGAQRASPPEQPTLLNLGAALPTEYPGISYRNVP